MEQAPLPVLGSGDSAQQIGAAVRRGVNFESNKVAKHAFDHGAVAVLNAQIAMDAPFAGQVADEALRSQGPSEERMPGFRRDRRESGLQEAVTAVVRAGLERRAEKLIVQIGRGKNAPKFVESVGLVKMLDEICRAEATKARSDHVDAKRGDKEEDRRKRVADAPVPQAGSAPLPCELVFGYRSNTFFVPTGEDQGPFAFLNIGMFARFDESITPGQVFTCEGGRSVVGDAAPAADVSPSAKRRRRLVATEVTHPPVVPTTLEPVYLLGVADDMPFITPEDYECEELLELFP